MGQIRINQTRVSQIILDQTIIFFLNKTTPDKTGLDFTRLENTRPDKNRPDKTRQKRKKALEGKQQSSSYCRDNFFFITRKTPLLLNLGDWNEQDSPKITNKLVALGFNVRIKI